MQTLIKKRGLLTVALFSTLLTGCGGGSVSGTLDSSMVSNSVSAGSQNVTAGQSTAISAHATMRGDTPSSMTWTITPLSATSVSDTVPQIGDLNCATASLVASPGAAVSGVALAGEGLCSTVVNIPFNAKAGTWRLTNTAKGKSSSASGYVDITVAALPASGFQLVESSVPVTGYVNKQLSMTAPFAVNPGMSVKNVKYTWTADTANPAILAIAGAHNSAVTVVPVTSGQYKFNVTATAEINGFAETTSGSVVAIVNPPSFTDIIDAGLPQKVAYDQIVSLTGTILNKDSALNYQTSWKQIDGVNGGPTTVTMANANSSTASFVVPRTSGTYGFEYKVIKTQADGSQMITTANTFVIVNPSATGVFTVSAGDAQTVKRGAVAMLRGSVGTQGTTAGVTYGYKWTQVSGPTVAITNDTTTSASIVPSTNGAYVFQFQVTATAASGTQTIVSGQTQVIVTDDGTGTGPISTPATYALTASAGNAQAIAPNAVATLTGTYTAQGTATGITYAFAWTQIGATPAAVTLSNPNTAIATFIPTVAGTYGFRLTVTATLSDGTTKTATSDTQVLVGAAGNTFSVSAGNAQTIAQNTATNLVGTVTTQGSYSGATFTYAWTQVDATPAAVAISNDSSLTASYLPTTPGTYTFRLTVTSNQGGTTQTQSSQTQVLVTP